MKLSCLIKGCTLVSRAGSRTDKTYDPDILSITSDSRNVRPGGLFIAIQGLMSDGHDYISQAFENGALAVVAENNPDHLDHVILVENSRICMASIAAVFYGNPSENLTLVGITGTNGKTTTTWILESIFKACGFSTGVMGTINIRYKDQVLDAPVTTPDSIDLQRTLRLMKDAGVTHVIMEVSSHGLDLNRVDFCRFDAGVFTNLTQDHLDYHKTLDEYFECKKRFFTQFLGPNGKNNAPAILNIDDPKGSVLFKALGDKNLESKNLNHNNPNYQSQGYKTLGVSTKKQTDIFTTGVIDTILGLSGTLHLGNDSFELSSSLTGRFNLENILCAVGAAHALNIEKEQIKAGLNACRSIPGRLEKIDTPIDRFVFVDYAHTPDALESILTTLRQRAPKRLITVFGCGGDRDRTKRPLMGQIACRYSDIAIVSSDNPRTENPKAIAKDILQGIGGYKGLTEETLRSDPFARGYLVEVDRKKALKHAIFLSKPGDIIVAAGKGHETYQITNAGVIHFDDKEELQAAALEFADQFTPIAWTPLDLSQALDMSAGISGLGLDHRFSGISTDSRTITPDQVFLALKGEAFDGHAFVKDLVIKGIKGFVVEKGFIESLDEPSKRDFSQKDLVVVETPDTLIALGQLARYQRLRSKVKVLAITGSSGKTTTRQITREIFTTQFHTLVTLKNFNNEIGLPLTLLNLSSAHEWAIVEMGMNHPGEISRLSQIALPDIAMVTNTGGAHLEGLGTLDNVARAKAEIFEGMREKGTAILFADDPRRRILEEKARANKNIDQILFFGSRDDADIRCRNIERSGTLTRFTARVHGQEEKFIIHSPAVFMVDNCLSAIGAARTAGIHTSGIQKGIAAFTPVSGRMDIVKISHAITLIDDTYNANPASVIQALKTLEAMAGGKNSIAVLGDMLELGEASKKLHWEIGRQAALSKISKLYVHGDQAKHILEGAVEHDFSRPNIFHGTKKKIARKVLKNSVDETWVLVKGSRGMTMETVIQELKHLLTLDS